MINITNEINHIYNYSMGEKKQGLTVKDFQKHKENPFVTDAIEKINDNLVKKYKNSAGQGERAVLQAVDENGEIKGHTTFMRLIEVDEDQFTKLFLSGFSAFWDLKSQAIRVFGYIMTQLQPNKDIFMFFIEDCMEHTGYKSEKSVYIGLASLLDSGVIARGRTDTIYYINPMIAFNGNRATFAKTIVKKKKIEGNPNQIDMFGQNQIGKFEGDV